MPDHSDFSWDELLELVKDEHVVPIVGRDLLTLRRNGRDVPLYPWLATRLAEVLQVSADDLPRGEELNAIACRYLEAGGRSQSIYAKLKGRMPTDEELPVPEPLQRLAEIRPFRLFVTTTFDSLLRRAVDDVRGYGTEVLTATPDRWQDLAENWDQLDHPTVYHLFGQLSAIPAYAVTQEDTLEYVHALEAVENKPERLLDELERNNLLLLGVSFGGWLARFFLRTTKRHRLLLQRDTNWVADDRARSDQGLVVFLRTFSSGTEIYDGGATEFVTELHQRWTKKYPRTEGPGASPAPRRAASRMVSGSVFLSYASEDAAAVKILKDALEKTGIDVFFDKQDLKAGDDFKAELRQAIHGCSLFIPVISEQSLTDERRFFRREWNQALDEALEATGRFIMPVVLDGTSPEEEAIPERFRKTQWEKAAGGRPSPKFVAVVQEEVRRYHKSLRRAS